MCLFSVKVTKVSPESFNFNVNFMFSSKLDIFKGENMI